MTHAREPLLDVKDLRLEFRTSRGAASVLNGVSFQVRPGETLCIVGESGCGKSMTSLATMRLIPSPPGRITGGSVRFAGEELLQATEQRMREIRGNRIAMIFQEPMTSLNPVMTVGRQLVESLRLHLKLSREAARARTIELLRAVGIPAPEARIDEYPHQMSGGMKQRVMIAMALACRPAILIADEPTTALDVTVQAQIFDLLRELQAREGTAIVLITHDMGAVSEMADRVVVMYGGRVVEQGATRDVLERPAHPYTQGLIACLPELEGEARRTRPPLPEIPGVVPSIWELGTGCAFRDRCPRAMAQCGTQVPALREVGDDHRAACWALEADAVATLPAPEGACA
ncbi:peptide/nickel transport system ATP-binding protein [Cupriavidus gilardii J11]|uniref:Peptide/nickel transport system ATP-binding protein n=1 Tax=Cupriavidus gilardii J11 TaxID=936133 RepID=A0A562BSU4_9BURK|nr:ABC transporter ATP-binding protein [Cupriavidus gilardii]TWG88337.1 peptide/nickel transport system ATP-binding protein [Cupriavidus gilardii J11]